MACKESTFSLLPVEVVDNIIVLVKDNKRYTSLIMYAFSKKQNRKQTNKQTTKKNKTAIISTGGPLVSLKICRK